ncbi:hypothetical protein OH76DRAFT_193289 [Lentinus brumalis]|uniref:C2H2-type domain-containing protein n=1 Tax=Lentinus brumalis TaxID=2498619 RepID=A0A371CMU8_9APHY|nr:hypothetical protein OH76DRAFT_193289 [Polyporus brumalis]
MPSVWSSGGLPDSFALPSNLVGTLAPIPGGDAQQYGMPLSATNPLPTPVKLSETSQVNIPPQRTRAQKSGGRKDKPHQCQSCKKYFTRKSNLKQHRLEHHDKTFRKFQCKHCEKEYVRANALRNHVLLRHSDDVANVSK